MLFNSIEFLLFFPAVCVIYFLLGKNKYRNPFLLAASYFFFMNWKPYYALLILGSTVISYVCGILIERSRDTRARKLFLAASLLANFGILFAFKYFNFMSDSLSGILSAFGFERNIPHFMFTLPVGISFYIFQVAGYSIDVYRGSIAAERNFITYALFVSFFPQLVAGPIERAGNLLPQFHREHRFDPRDAAEGIRLMIWGFFMKLCVADILGEYVDAVYNNIPEHNGTSLFVATLFFAFQIYCDFAGYSCIAIGAARIMGYRLMQNFRQPYFSLSVKEFWTRWHISLSSWLRDYLYIPLGGNRVKYGRYLLNLLITFFVSGLWHGAEWTFVLWGVIHGVFLIAESLLGKVFNIQRDKNFVSRVVSTVICFFLVCFAWIFFRADTIGNAFTILARIFTDSGPLFIGHPSVFISGLAGMAILIFKDAADRFGHGAGLFHSRNIFVKHASIVLAVTYILLFGALSASSFIYFQF